MNMPHPSAMKCPLCLPARSVHQCRQVSRPGDHASGNITCMHVIYMQHDPPCCLLLAGQCSRASKQAPQAWCGRPCYLKCGCQLVRQLLHHPGVQTEQTRALEASTERAFYESAVRFGRPHFRDTRVPCLRVAPTFQCIRMSENIKKYQIVRLLHSLAGEAFVAEWERMQNGQMIRLGIHHIAVKMGVQGQGEEGLTQY
jgi:hypothetical protein